ncbi:MAG: ribosome biogenesis protein ytm1 [Bathelium mastoideum]|nr:MAG: ribosome biogenesis protein ytm1 [Bathelium mastoideum]
MAPSSEEISGAILQSVRHANYPDSEDVASAELSTETLPTLLQALDSAKDEVKTNIRDLSREAAPDIDGWIAQAKQLQADIERSKATAREIVQQAEASKALDDKINDASSQVGLLKEELAFNGILSEKLTRIKEASKVLNDAQNSVITKDIPAALDGLDRVGKILADDSLAGSARVYDLLQNRTKRLRDDLVKESLERWHALVQSAKDQSRITIHKTVERDAHFLSIEDVTTALARLEILDGTVDRFCKDVIKTVRSRFTLAKTQSRESLELNITEEGTLKKISTSNDARVGDALEDFPKLIQWLEEFLPNRVTTLLSSTLLSPLISHFIKDWLEWEVPSSLDQMQSFENTLQKINSTAEAIEKYGWAGGEALADWVETAPRTWLTKRKERTLDAARQTILKGLSETKVVERVETEMVAKDDVMRGGHEQANDDWDIAWDEADGKDKKQDLSTEANDEDDEDTSAWDMEDAPETACDPESSQDADQKVNGADEEDAWGWEDDNHQPSESSHSPIKPKKQIHKANGSKAFSQAPMKQEITLRETLTVTSVPDGLIEIILQVLADAEDFAKPEFSQSTITHAAAGLYPIPTLILALYRATASTCYSTLPASNMFLYNDSARLSDRLRSFLREQAQKEEHPNSRASAKPATKLKLELDIKALDSLSRRAYGQEMESQRTTLRDLLNGARGFANCTEPPFAGECDSAVSTTVNHIRDVYNQWKDILSRSALLQSIGSLVFTVISKVIADIEDMPNIGEEESQRLRHFCDEISQLNDLFVQKHPDESVASDMTLYVIPNWFKFQYLGQIMDSSLADIVYMWKESELRLEYEASEIIDLIEALFAESEHRYKAIGEIKKNVGGGGLTS